MKVKFHLPRASPRTEFFAIRFVPCTRAPARLARAGASGLAVFFFPGWRFIARREFSDCSWKFKAMKFSDERTCGFVFKFIREFISRVVR